MLIQSYFPDPPGGAEQQCRLQAEALQQLGCAVTVLTRWPGPGVPRRERVNGVHIVRVGWVEPLLRGVLTLKDRLRPAATRARHQRLQSEQGGAHMQARPRRNPLFLLVALRDLSFAVGVWAWVRRNRKRLDVLHVHEAHWIAGLGTWVGARAGVPALAKVATFPVLVPVAGTVVFSRHWDRWRRCGRFIALNEQMRRDLVAEGIAGDRVFVVPNGVRIPEHVPPPGERDSVLMVGNFVQGRRKGFDVMLDAWARIARRFPAVQLRVVGAGSASHWQDRAAALGIPDRVAFGAFTPRISEEHARALVFVLPSRFEGMSNALLEAMAAGLPVLASDIPANAALIIPGENGCLFPSEDSAALAACLEGLLADAPLRQRLGAQGRRTVEETHAMHVVAENLRTLYTTLPVQPGKARGAEFPLA